MCRFPLLARPALSSISRPSRRHAHNVAYAEQTLPGSQEEIHYTHASDELHATASLLGSDITTPGHSRSNVTESDHPIASISALPPTHDHHPPAQSVSARLRARRGLSEPSASVSPSISPPSLEDAAFSSAGQLHPRHEVDPEARTARRRARRLLKKIQAREQEEARREQLALANSEKKAAKKIASRERRSALVQATKTLANGDEPLLGGSDLLGQETLKIAERVTLQDYWIHADTMASLKRVYFEDPITPHNFDEYVFSHLSNEDKGFVCVGPVVDSWPSEPWADVVGDGLYPGSSSMSKPRGRKLSPVQQALRRKREETQRRFPDGRLPHLLGLHELETLPKRLVQGTLETDRKDLLTTLESPSEHKPIARLAHGLDRVLFNPGVHWLQDPRSRVFNFAPCIQNIPKVEDFAFERLQGFVRSSNDDDLWTLAKREERRYTGSTSSLSGFMSHIYFLLSGDKDVNTSMLSSAFVHEPRSFTPGQRMPSSIVMNYKDGIYSLDSGWGVASPTLKTVLTWMGTLLENFLTHDEAQFRSLLRATPSPNEADEPPMREAYRFSKSNRFVMRSQLDCVDPRLPGTGVFDIKTRAALPIRMDMMNYEENSGYQIHRQYGILESFEREYYDLIRSAFLKYSMQVRIGNMDGVMVAYHNTARIFGFQYISLEDMDNALYGGSGRGDHVFSHCVGLMEALCDEIAMIWPEESVRLMLETLEGENALRIFALKHDWGGAEEDRPIVEMLVYVENFLDGQGPVLGKDAVNMCNNQRWDVNYHISTLDCSTQDSYSRLDDMRARQHRAWALPTGMSLEEMSERFAEIDHGGSRARALAAGEEPEEDPIQFDPAFFQLRPSPQTNILRKLARRGKLMAKKIEARDKGRPTVVYTPFGVDEVSLAEATTEIVPEERQDHDDQGFTSTDSITSSTIKSTATEGTATGHEALVQEQEVSSSVLGSRIG